MSTAAIVGAGQGGLHLAFGLLRDGHDVTIITDRGPAEIEKQNAMASHTLQAPALARERAAGACASDFVPQNWGVGVDFALSLDGRHAASAWQGDWEEPSAALDLRLKYPLLLRRFEQQGGILVVANATTSTLEQLTLDFDMVFVATGKAALGELFAVDDDRTVFDRPQRRLAQLHVRGVPSPKGQERLYFRFLPGHGEIFMGPLLHVSREPAYTLLIEGLPGGEFDRFGEVGTAEHAIDVARAIIREHLPWEPVLEHVELTDPRAFLKGSIRPLVRRPTAHLPSGRPVHAVGDVAIVHDPIAGQGGNCTVAYVDHLLATIASTGGRAPDPGLVDERFDEFWNAEGRWAAGLSAAMVSPSQGPLQLILAAAQGSRAVADRVAAAFAHPDRLVPFLESETSARAFIDATAARRPAHTAS